MGPFELCPPRALCPGTRGARAQPHAVQRTAPHNGDLCVSGRRCAETQHPTRSRSRLVPRSQPSADRRSLAGPTPLSISAMQRWLAPRPWSACQNDTGTSLFRGARSAEHGQREDSATARLAERTRAHHEPARVAALTAVPTGLSRAIRGHDHPLQCLPVLTKARANASLFVGRAEKHMAWTRVAHRTGVRGGHSS